MLAHLIRISSRLRIFLGEHLNSCALLTQNSAHSGSRESRTTVCILLIRGDFPVWPRVGNYTVADSTYSVANKNIYRTFFWYIDTPSISPEYPINILSITEYYRLLCDYPSYHYILIVNILALNIFIFSPELQAVVSEYSAPTIPWKDYYMREVEAIKTLIQSLHIFTNAWNKILEVNLFKVEIGMLQYKIFNLNYLNLDILEHWNLLFF